LTDDCYSCSDHFYLQQEVAVVIADRFKNTKE